MTLLTRILFSFALVAGLVTSLMGPGSAAAQADTREGTYTDPVYFFGFSWDPDIYDANELVDGEDVSYGVTMENEAEFGSLSAGGYSSPRRCLTERSDLFVEIEGVDNFAEVDDLDWPETDPDARAALYRYDYENPDTGDTGAFVQYFECRDLLVDGEPIEDVVLTFDMGIAEASYEDALPAWEDILASIEWDVESGSTDDPDENNNGSPAEGVDGNVYIDPQYLWIVEWDDDILTGENWILDEDEGPIGVQIFGEEGNFLTIFATEGTSIRSCTNSQVDILEGSAFTDFVEVEDIDLPEISDEVRSILLEGTFTGSSGDTAPVYFYASCRPLIVDGEEIEDMYLAVNLIVVVEFWEDELELWTDILGTIDFDAIASNNDDRDNQDELDDDTDQTDQDDTNGESGIDGDLFISALGFQVGWDDATYTAELLDDDNPDRGIQVTSEGSFITIQAAGDPDADACVEAEVSILEGFDGMGRVRESDKEGPDAPRGAASGLYESVLESSSGSETDITIYVECRPLAELDDATLFVVVSMIAFGDAYDDELAAWQDILDSIEITE